MIWAHTVAFRCVCRSYDTWYESNVFIFFVSEYNCSKNKFTWLIHTSFCNYQAILHQFEDTLPTLSEMLCTSVVKFPASTSEHIRKIAFNLLSSAKWRPSSACILYRGKQEVPAGCEVWAVSRTGKKVHVCASCVRLGIVVKEKEVFHVSVRKNCTDVFFAVCLNFPCTACGVLRSRDREFYDNGTQRLT
jgi:hypothetical protein